MSLLTHSVGSWIQTPKAYSLNPAKDERFEFLHCLVSQWPEVLSITEDFATTPCLTLKLSKEKQLHLYPPEREVEPALTHILLEICHELAVNVHLR